ncbi:hypothetical protein HNR62_001448 [Oceanisphaera litoralis]|uniref:glycosyltransferase family 1 protein n=1 Tax=Oceanisphaera litoralis TaxID=225144 RepID=UPI00195D4E79|nr:glycosyltransferase family 1 protein [Oceanisphaera litoralis]MBM7455576.1 hypothetical protein [Oceanisphaera litoralis]
MVLNQQRTLIVEQGPNPTTDFFILPWLQSIGSGITRRGLNDTLPSSAGEYEAVVFVRYLTPAWRKWVEQHRSQLGEVVFFMDDDLFDLRAHAGLPWRYRYKLWQLAWRHQRWLKKIGAELWVSTPWLAEKYAGWQPKVLQPQSPYSGISAQKTLFYHGSASHGPEFEWLYPVFEQVLAQDASLSVELIGNHKVRRQFAALPRVHVLHPMPWPAYQALLSRPGRTIGLAPLLDSPFNQARSATKFFDITQAGAVGIYADHPVYRSVIQHQYNGLLLPMDQQAWIDAILRLSKQDPSRQNMLKNASDFTHQYT